MDSSVVLLLIVEAVTGALVVNAGSKNWKKLVLEKTMSLEIIEPFW